MERALKNKVLSATTSGNNFLTQTRLNEGEVGIFGFGLDVLATRHNNGGIKINYSKNDNSVGSFVWRGWTDDEDAYTTPFGCTYFGERSTHIPSNYCTVLTLGMGQGGVQLAVDQDGYLWSRRGTTWRKCATV